MIVIIKCSKNSNAFLEKRYCSICGDKNDTHARKIGEIFGTRPTPMSMSTSTPTPTPAADPHSSRRPTSEPLLRAREKRKRTREREERREIRRVERGRQQREARSRLF
ncbi:hypothetical protein PUN28_016049 [Cardiocondyla obscurior]|uniref:Uncharacterized protein n=1 Tax=Cardiocondyla obscurior TaxID=286306 RepID=A0AAW2EQN3_9HYME